MKQKSFTMFSLSVLFLGLLLGFTSMQGKLGDNDPIYGQREITPQQKLAIDSKIQIQSDNNGGNYVSGIPYYTDNFNGANDTTSLKSRGYYVYYRGTGLQGLTATWFQGSTPFTAYNGPDSGYVAANYNAVTGTNNIDNWLVLPPANVTAGDKIVFYERSITSNPYPDSIRVMYSNTGSITPEDPWVELGRFEAETSGEWTRVSFTAPTSGATARYAIRYAVVDGGPSGLNSNYIGIDALTLESPFPNANDIKAEAFISPLNGATVGAGVPFSPQASFTNYGNNDQTNVPVRYQIINAGSVVVYDSTTTIASITSGETQTATFPTGSVTSGVYTIKAIAELPGDEDLSNDTITGSISTGAALNGLYLIGSEAFNRISGKNITFEKVVKKVVREVWESDDSKISKENYKADPERDAALTNGRLVKKEVEEVTWVPMENGTEYKGRLFVSNTESSSGGPGFYPTLTAAVNDLNALGATGPVTFELLDVNYPSETFPITINSYPGMSSVNKLTINPSNGIPAVISGNVPSALIKINGADYVTINGLNTGGTSLTFTNTNTGGANIWIGSQNSGNGATDNTITNIISNGPSVGGIIAGSGTTLGNEAEAPNSNNTVTGSSFSNTQNGIYMNGNSTTLDDNWTITGNNFGSTTDTLKHTFRGIAIINSANFNVSYNTIAGVLSTSTSTSTVTGISVFGNSSGGTIAQNKISDIFQSNSFGWGCNGIGLFSSSTAADLLVANNFISGVRAYGYENTTSIDNGYGMMVSAGGGYNIYYNTVEMDIDQFQEGLPAAMNVGSGVVTDGSLDLRNNIFQNSQTVGTERYSINSDAPNTRYLNINYNDYYTTGPNLGYLGVDAADLSAWQTATGQDANSSSVLVNFVNPSTNDLHLAGASIGDANLAGTPLAAVTTDIDGEPRGSSPYMGADQPAVAGTLTLKLNFQACPNSSPITVEIRSSTSPYNLIETVNANGGGNVNSLIGFTNVTDGTPYYLVVKSVNMIETWSATTFTFTGGAASYDFTSALSQAYGSNQTLSSGIPSVYQGDANQDGFVNLTDVNLINNEYSTFSTSPATDLNCDGFTNLLDVILASNNFNAFVQKQTP